MTSKKLAALFAPAAIVVAIDQYTKWLVRTTPELHRLDIIDGWLQFYYTQNSGMAMGIDLLSTPVISTISIVATIGILAYLLFTLKKANSGYLIFMGLVLGGAIGNIIDRLIMGYIEGYGGLLDGHVVDFIHFNLVLWDKPVFPYIFNVADIAITVSIVSLILFSKKLIPHDDHTDSESREKMILSRSHGDEIDTPSKEDLTAAVNDIADENGSFIILGTDYAYMQVAGNDPASLTLEYREEGTQYQCSPVTADQAKSALLQYLNGDESYKTKLNWSEVTL
ncbi:MAG TPA: hypothetical protein DEQ34_05840 [Balneolaceae bacterium]|nr:hypothetical protein [Balneolaceae bacterium]